MKRSRDTPLSSNTYTANLQLQIGLKRNLANYAFAEFYVNMWANCKMFLVTDFSHEPQLHGGLMRFHGRKFNREYLAC